MNNRILILKSFQNELEKNAVGWPGIIGIGKKILNTGGGFTKAISSGVRWAMKGSQEARAAGAAQELSKSQRLHSADRPFLKTKSGETRVGQSGNILRQSGAKGTYNIQGQEVGTAQYNKERIARKQKLYNYIQSRTPAAKMKRAGKVGLGGIGATAGIAGAGTVYGGLTMEPSISGSGAGEMPSIGPVYGGRY